MRVAAFTNNFPGRVNTFFARDIAPLLRAGIDVEVFPLYPLDDNLWRYVPDILSETTLDRAKIHHTDLKEVIRSMGRARMRQLCRFVGDTLAINASAARFGVEPLIKTTYVALKAWIWAQHRSKHYDHILAYWGNYAATGAYIFRRLTDEKVPLTIFLHAGIDLYENPVYLRQKLLDAQKIITCSDFNRQFIQEHFRDIYTVIANKIYVHHHGVDLSEFAFQSDGRPPDRILAIGGFSEYKGFDYLLRAGKELMMRGVDFKIELVGDGKDAPLLKGLAHNLRIADRVSFHGWQNPANIPTLIRGATVFVHPSTRLFDGVPNVIKESMAAGTPVIASRVAGIPEVLGDGRYGLLVPPKDAHALADAIATLLGSQEQRLKYSHAARQYAEQKFDLWRNGQQLADVLYTTTRERIEDSDKW